MDLHDYLSKSVNHVVVIIADAEPERVKYATVTMATCLSCPVLKMSVCYTSSGVRKQLCEWISGTDALNNKERCSGAMFPTAGLQNKMKT